MPIQMAGQYYEEEQPHSYPAHGTSSHTGSAAANR